MATRKGRTGRKTKSMRRMQTRTKSMRRMQTRTKSRMYKMRGGISSNKMTDVEIERVGNKIADIQFKLGNPIVPGNPELYTKESVKAEIDAMLKEEDITDFVY